MSVELGPVSAALEADLRTWVRRQGLVLWLDIDNHYSGFIDRLARLRSEGSLPYEVQSFRGSHLELMLALEPLCAGVEKAPLVVHLPGFNEETVPQTPLLELYEAGVRYRKSLSTLVTEAAAGQVRLEQIEAFLQQDGLTLDAADAWLAAMLGQRTAGLASVLEPMSLPAVIDDLLSAGFLAKRIAAPEDREVLWERLAAWTGLSPAWRAACLTADTPRAEDMAFTVASWALGVEYVHDLRRPPVAEALRPLSALPPPLVKTCRELADHLRARHAAFYRRTADETEARLPDEVEVVRAEDLGKIDTFRFEDEKVLKDALVALGEERWSVACQSADRLLSEGSFWLREAPARQSAWQLIGDAARLGASIATAGPKLSAESLEDALACYVQRGAAVDQAHRHLEQRRLALLYPQLPEFETLRARLDGLRQLWRRWADGWARDFNALCKAHGFVPPASLQQRTLFDEVVRPLTQDSETTALVVVDGLRFEMAEELYRAMSDTPATTPNLRARLAELPTVTEVGMNVLAPVADRGRLRPALDQGAILGFSTSSFRVSNPESRKRAMHDRVGGPTCPWLTLDEVLNREVAGIKRSVAQARLVVIHSREIDEAGEKGAGLAVFDLVLQKLRAAWRLLREAGVRRFVITADHGFLLLDESAATAQAHGRKVDPKRRYVISQVPADHPGEVRVALADLGYEGVEGQLMFPESTAVFDTGQQAGNFVHGGNSLQERVIPVLTLVHRTAAGGSTLRYTVTAKPLEGVGGMHCLEATVEVADQHGLDFGGVHEVELGLRAPEAPEVQAELCQTRGGARLATGAVVATVGQRFELFFRLAGTTESRALVELHHPGAEADVTPCVLDGRFAVNATRAAGQEAPAGSRVAPSHPWLTHLPDEGVRRVFQHLADHGAITETEAAAMLGGQRGLRRFAMRFEEYATKAPFAVRIDVVAGVKRYVREGASS